MKTLPKLLFIFLFFIFFEGEDCVRKDLDIGETGLEKEDLSWIGVV
jgi:hypothetical protein